MNTEANATKAWAQALEQDPLGEERIGAVLLSDEIKYYATKVDPPLITDFDEKNLKPARYHLTLGPEAIVSGQVREVTPTKPLIIAPHQVAIVRTYEQLNIPRFLIARWNLRVDMVYKGLLWVGALQVDPGWAGYLPSPLYNLSDREVQINFRDKLFTMDFVRTTRFGKECKTYYQPDYEPNPPLIKFDPHKLRSGPYEKLRELDDLQSRLTDFRTELTDFKNLMNVTLGTLVSALALIVAALALTTIWELPRRVIGFVSFFAFLLAILGVVLAVLALRKRSKTEPTRRTSA